MKKIISIVLTCTFASYLAFALTGKNSSLSSFIKSAVSSAEQMLASYEPEPEQTVTLGRLPRQGASEADSANGDVYNDNFASWVSDNHESSSVSEYTWRLDCLPNTILSFDYTLSSMYSYDYLDIYLDENYIVSWNGAQSGTYKVTISEAGEHVLKAQYRKVSSDSGADNASIMNIKLSVTELPAEYLDTYVLNFTNRVQKKCEQLSGFDAIIAQLQAAIAELNAMVDTEEQSVVMSKAKELIALADRAIETKNKYAQLSDVVIQHKEVYVVTGNVELGNAITQAEAVLNAKATLTIESSVDIDNAIKVILDVADAMNLSDTKVWDFSMSAETIAGLASDGNWSNYDSYFQNHSWSSADDWGQLAYSREWGVTCIIPETEGIYFYNEGRYWSIYKDGTNRIRTNGAGTNSAFMLKNLERGQTVTINYSPVYEGGKCGINRYSENTTLVSGQERINTGSAEVIYSSEVIYKVTSDGDVSFYPHNNSIYINSISVTIPAAPLRLAELRKEAVEFIATLDSFPGLKNELQLAYDSTVIPGDGADADNIADNFKTTLRNVQKAVEIYPIVCEDIEAAKAALKEEAYVDLSEALALGNAVDVNTSASADYMAAYDALEKALAVYRSDKVDMADWSFDTNTVCVVDGLRYYLDTTNNLAEFINFDKANAYSGALNIPAVFRYDGTSYAVVAMINASGNYQDSITSVTLPKSLRQIGDYGLSYLTNVHTIEIPENVTTMGSNVFYGSDNLTTIKVNAVIPPTVASLSGSSRKKISVPTESFHAYRVANVWKDNILIGGDGVTVSTGMVAAGDLGHIVLAEATYLQEVNRLIIDEGTLNSDDWNSIKLMTNLVEVDMSGVTMSSLPDDAFSGRWAIADIKLPHNLTSIGTRALRGTGIRQMTLPETVATLGNGAFENCDSLRAINIPQVISAVPDYCFNGCKSLGDVVLPTGLTSIGTYSFSGCPLKTVDIPAGITVIKYRAFSSNSAIESLLIPENVISIEDNAFCNCTSLQNVTFCEGLVNLYGYAFEDCDKLTEIVLPSSLERCERSPFNGCNSVKKFEARSVIPPTTGDYCPLDNVDLNEVVLYVPSWSTGEYALAEGWSSFYTVETTDYMPQYIKVNKDFYFTVRDAVSSDYRPNIAMTYSDVQSSDAYGHSSYERGNLTISGRSKLAVNDLSLVVSPYAKYYSDHNVAEGRDYDYHRTNLNSTSLIVNGEMRAENVSMELNNYNNRWQFVTFPFDVKVSDIVPQEEGISWVIRGHDGAMRAAGKADSVWVNLTADDILEAGKGYIMHNYSQNKDNSWFWVYPMKNSVNRQLIFSSEDRTIPLEENLAEFDHNRSWNLIGNPYPCFYDTRFMEFDAPFMVWDSYNRNYVAFNPADDAYILSPGEAFFLQRPFEQESITFRKDGRQTHRYARELTLDARSRAKAANNNARTIYNLTLRQDNISDRTRVVFNDDAALTYEMSRDAAKFAGAERNVPQIFTMAGQTRYAINERPFMTGDVALGVYCNVEGEYTISLDKTYGCRVVLEDRIANKFVELSADNSYTFCAFAGEDLTRFVLHFGNNATGVENVNVDADNTDDAIYSLQGIKVDNTDSKGIYITNGKKTIIK